MACRLSARYMRAVAAFLMILMLLIPTCVFAQGAAKVVDVVITGNQNINTETIRNAVTLNAGDEYTEQAVEKDRAAIMSLGYFSAVTKRIEQVPDGVKVTYEVTENPKVTEVRIVGNEPISEERILEVMKTRAGQVLNTATLDQDIDAIMGIYRDEQYVAYPTEDTGIDPQTGVLTIAILVHTVEDVEITGLRKTRPYVLLREMMTEPGSYFNVGTLREDIIRIYNLDILEEVKNYQVVPGSELGTVRVVLPVVEKKTGQVSLGFGYSSKQRLVGQARLSESNFRGRGQGVNLLWEQGTSDAVGGSASYEASFFEPWIDKNHTSLSVSAYNKVVYRFSSGVLGSGDLVDDTPYNERHKGGDVTLSRPLSERTRVYLGGKFENVDTDPSLLSQTGPDYFKIVQTGDVLSGSLRLVHNTRDFDLDPAAGGYEGVSLEFGSTDGNRFTENAAGGFDPVPFDGTYQKSSIDIRRYFSRQGRKVDPKDKRTVLAVRLRAGLAGGTLPFFEQFFVGGSESLRGYREDRFWGDKMLLASIELRKPIAQSITGVAFLDYGDAWGGDPSFFIDDPDFSQSESFDGNVGVGIGMRVTTPIGHLRLDYGIGSEGGRTHFSMGHAF